MTNSFQVHRLRDSVAIYLRGKDSAGNVCTSQTIYLPTDVAELVADAIRGAVADIKANRFSESEFRTVSIPREDA